MGSPLYLFLDFDGVIITLGSAIYHRQNKTDGEVDPVAIALLQRIISDYPEIKIVISSTWRKFSTMDELKSMLGEKLGAVVIDKTPVLQSGYRGHEIAAWLKENAPGTKPQDIIILDDDADMSPYMGSLLKTNPYTGFTAIDYIRLTDYLKKKPKDKKISWFLNNINLSVKRVKWKVKGKISLMTWRVRRLFKPN